MLADVLGIFTEISQWISATLPTIMTMFYNEQGFTYLGILATAGLAISVAFLLIWVVSKFLKFRA